MEEKGQNYLIPTSYKEEDALDLEYTALKVATVLETLDRAGCNLSLVFLDACRSSTLPARSMSGGTRSLGRGLAKIEAPTGMLISFACAPGSTASDGAGRNGVYTSSLLEHLPREEDVQKVLGYVVSGVKRSTNGSQVPWMSGALARDPGRNNGNIHLIEPQLQSTSATAPSAPASRTSSVTALDEAAAVGADVAGLTLWLARIGLAKHESSVIPKLVTAGVLTVEEVEEVDANDVAELGLPKLEQQKLIKALTALANERKAKADAERRAKPSMAPPAYGGPPPPQPPPPGHVSWPPLMPDDARRHAASFRVWDADGDGKVTGSEAKPLFAQSGVAPPSGVATVQWFKLIWDLADADVDGSLTLPEFVVASYFLEQAAKGHPPPAAIPPGIFPPPHALMAAAGAGGPGMQAPPPGLGLGLGQMQAPPPEQAPRAPPVAPNSNIPAVPALPEHLFGLAPASDAAAARTAHGEATKAQAALVAADAQRVSSATAAAELTATVRELTLLKRRCEAELSEAEFAAQRAARQLAEARTAHDSQRAATEAVQARLQAAHTARQQAEAEIAELQAHYPGGADVQAAGLRGAPHGYSPPPRLPSL